jgi:hypothetical protein
MGTQMTRMPDCRSGTTLTDNAPIANIGTILAGHTNFLLFGIFDTSRSHGHAGATLHIFGGEECRAKSFC